MSEDNRHPEFATVNAVGNEFPNDRSDDFLALSEEGQREVVMALLGVGDDYPMVELINRLVSVRREYGYDQFFLELTRVKDPVLMAAVEKVAHVPQIAIRS